MLKDVYKVEARIETCSRGHPFILVDGTVAAG
jgi:iron complex transport system ATP-binding protein